MFSFIFLPLFRWECRWCVGFKIVYFVGFKICGDECLEFKISMGLGRLFGRDGCFLNGWMCVFWFGGGSFEL